MSNGRHDPPAIGVPYRTGPYLDSLDYYGGGHPSYVIVCSTMLFGSDTDVVIHKQLVADERADSAGEPFQGGLLSGTYTHRAHRLTLALVDRWGQPSTWDIQKTNEGVLVVFFEHAQMVFAREDMLPAPPR